MFKRKISKIVTLVLAIALMLSMLPALTGCGEDDRVNVGRAQWNYDVIQANIIIQALEDKGYNVGVDDIYEMGLMYAAIGAGTTDFYAVGWLPALQESYFESHADSLVAGGNLWGESMPLSWAIPAYTAEEHGIYSIEDLEGKSDIFNGRIYGYEAGTGGSERSLVALEEYGLSDEYELVFGSVPALLAELRASMQLNQPVMVVLWRPHPIFSQLDIQMLDDPMNIFGTNYCQYVANVNFAERHPEIIHFLDNFLITLEEMEAMMYENEEHGVSEEELALEWYNDNKATIDTWWP